MEEINFNNMEETCGPQSANDICVALLIIDYITAEFRNEKVTLSEMTKIINEQMQKIAKATEETTAPTNLTPTNAAPENIWEFIKSK